MDVLFDDEEEELNPEDTEDDAWLEGQLFKETTWDVLLWEKTSANFLTARETEAEDNVEEVVLL